MENDSWWMIEKYIDNIPHWWIHNDGQNDFWDSPDRWTTDHNLARHYNSKAEADYVIGKDMVGCVATEHELIKTD